MTVEQSLQRELSLYYDERRVLIENKIKEWIEDLPFLKELAYKALAGGKRFRGVLTLLICEALEGNLEEAVEYAAGIEFVHAATLLHDDVLDYHIFRRGKYSFWKTYDIHKAIVTGDFIFTYAGDRVARVSEKALSIISKAIYRTTLGILLESFPFEYPGPKSEVYPEVIKLKTGELFAGAAKLGALTSRDPNKMILAYRYGLLLGEAYQIADDIYDFRALTNDGSSIDLKPVKLALIHFEKLSDEEALELWKIKNEEEIVSLSKEAKLEEKLLNMLTSKLKEINNVLKFFPETRFKGFISYIPKYMVEAMIKYG